MLRPRLAHIELDVMPKDEVKVGLGMRGSSRKTKSSGVQLLTVLQGISLEGLVQFKDAECYGYSLYSRPDTDRGSLGSIVPMPLRWRKRSCSVASR